MSNPERWRKFKPLPEDIQQRLVQLQPIFEQNRVKLVYLFGSLAQDRMGHDIDLAILREGENASALYPAITELLGTERVDLVDLGAASPVVRFEVIRTGRLLFTDNEQAQLEFELETLRIYKDTNWMRKRQELILRERMAEWSSNELPSSSG